MKYDERKTKVPIEVRLWIRKQQRQDSTYVSVELGEFDINGSYYKNCTANLVVDGYFENYTSELKMIVWKELARLKLVDPPPKNQTDENKYQFEIARQQKWREILSCRDSAEKLGFSYLGKTFDSDPTSVARLMAASISALSEKINGKRFDLTWKLATNETVSLNSDQIIGATLALTQHSNRLHQKAEQLRRAIDGAGTLDDLNEIRWDEDEEEHIYPDGINLSLTKESEKAFVEVVNFI